MNIHEKFVAQVCREEHLGEWQAIFEYIECYLDMDWSEASHADIRNACFDAYADLQADEAEFQEMLADEGDQR